MKYVVLAAALVVWAVSGIQVYAQPVLLSEVSPANASLVDEDGATSDWIELYNRSDSAVNLKGYRIADRNDRAKAWVFPDTTLGVGQYLIVRASGADKHASGLMAVESAAYGINPWNTWDIFRYLYLPVEGDFDIAVRVHSLQQVGTYTKAGLLFVDTPERLNRHAGIFATTRDVFTFSVRTVAGQAPSHVRDFGMQVDFPHCWVRLRRSGDSVYAYASLLGDFWEPADSALCPAAKGYVGIAVASFDNTVPTRTTLSDLTLDGAPLSFGDLTVAEIETSTPGRHWYSGELHTDFELKAGGETVYLWEPTGALADSLACGEVTADITCGRMADSRIGYFAAGTPTAHNGNNGKMRVTTPPQMLPDGGAFTAPVEISFLTHAADRVFYTLDGRVPDTLSTEYTGVPIVLTSTATLRVRAYADDAVPGQTITRTFFINDPSTLPVVALATEPDYLWGDDGIFEHVFNEIEVPLHVEVWEKDGRLVLAQDAGAKVHGRVTRTLPQKSLRLFARGRYGEKTFGYPLFASKPIEEYSRLLLRNSGQDWYSTYIRDAVFSSLVADLHFDVQAYRPVTVFLNGRYWGIQNMRERIDEDFIAANAGVDPDNIHLLEENAMPKNGSSYSYHRMTDSLAVLDMETEDAYRYAASQIDIESFTDYMIAEIFAATGDWPQYNQRYWRERTPGSRWRWIMSDIDMGLGLNNDTTAWRRNMLAVATSPVQDAIINPPYSTFLLRTLLRSPRFRVDFINRTADLLNTTLHSERCLLFIDSLADAIAPEVPRHTERWDTSLSNWREEVDKMKYYVTHRHTAMREHYADAFQLDGSVVVRLATSQPNTGTIRFSTITPASLPWSGVYFTNVPITATAIPAPGYRFVRWQAEGLQQVLPDSATVTLQLHNDLLLTAVFLPEGQNEDYGVVINEIMYKPADAQDSKDWIELYNGSAQPVHLGGWTLRDDDDEHGFVLPSGTTIAAGGYLLLCNDSTAFRSVYDEVDAPLVGNVDFGFGTPSDQVRLYDAAGLVVDSVSYSSTPPWPADASGTGRSIELLHPSLDNTRGENWRSSGGTPGRVNGPGTSVGGSEPAAALSLQSVPHPFTAGEGGVLRVQLHSEAAALRIDIADLTGRCVYEVVGSGGYSRGEYSFALPSGNLSVGVYIVRAVVSVAGGEQHYVLPVVVVP